MNLLLRASLVAVLGLITLSPQTLPAQADIEKLRNRLKEGPPAYSGQELADWTKELVPLVEKAAGRKFRQAPKVRAVDRATLTGALQRELLGQFKVLLADQPEAQLRRLADMQSAMMAAVMFGKFAYEDGEVFMLPGNVAGLLAVGKVDARHTNSIVKIILAHELTHALQDQEIGLSRTLRSPSGLDRRTALNAVIEGHATLVQERVGRMLGLDDATLEVARLFAAGSVKLDDPALEILNRTIALQFEQIYLGGRNFMDFHVRKSGDESAWKILAAPPATSAMVGNPASYSPTAAAVPDLRKALAGMEKEFGAGNWKVQSIEVGAVTLQAVYGGMEPAMRKAAVDNVAYAYAFTAQRERSIANVSVYLVKDAAPLGRTLAALESLAESNVEKIKKGSAVKVEGFALSDFTAIKADHARRLNLTVSAPGEATVAQTIVRVARGKVMLELLMINMGLSDAKLAEIAEAAFTRVAAAK
jgi:hypothetical protein